MSNFAYLLLEIFDPYDGKHKYFCGFKKFFNYDDGYIGTNPHQYAIPGGEKKKNENQFIRFVIVYLYLLL